MNQASSNSMLPVPSLNIANGSQQQQAPLCAPYPRKCTCCRKHVEHGAQAIAIAGTVVAALMLLGALCTARWYQAGTNLIQLLIYAAIVYAQKRRQPALYLPYLVVAGAGLALMVVLYVLLILAMFMLPYMFHSTVELLVGRYYNQIYGPYGGQINYQGITEFIQLYIQATIGLVLLFLFVLLVIYALLYAVVYSAWKHLVKEKRDRSGRSIYPQGLSPPASDCWRT